jgi:ABC-2 type transport system ATP-binding protein
MEVSDTATLARTLDNMHLEYEIISDTQADIFAKVNVTQIVTELARGNCQVISMQERDESLESFYMSLVGGGKHE